MRLSCKFEICKSPKCSPLKCKSKKTVFLQYLDFFFKYRTHFRKFLIDCVFNRIQIVSDLNSPNSIQKFSISFL